MRVFKFVAPLGALAGLSLAACGHGGGGNGPAAGDGGADAGSSDAALPLSTFAIQSDTACRIDIDCADDLYCFQGACVFECNTADDCRDGDTCSARRQCQKAEQDGVGTAANAATPEVVPGIGIVELPPDVLSVRPGQDTITITLKTTKPLPSGVLGYTVETYARASGDVRLPTQVLRAEGTDTFDIVVPTLSADPAGDKTGIVEVQVATSVGSFRTTLRPLPFPAGVYAGSVTVPRFGALGLPMDLEIVTDPAGVPLESASSVYLVLPVREGNVFSPVAPGTSGVGDAVRVDLTRQDFDGKWVGRTRSAFNFGSDSMLARYGAGTVVRGLRFELTLDGTNLSGAVRDTWDGLYDARTADGVASAAAVVFQGTLQAQRAGAPRALADLPSLAPQVTSAAAQQALPDLAGPCPNPQFAVADLTVNSTLMTCTGITSAATFAAAAPAAQASCATAVAETALRAGNTTADLITAFLKGDTATTGTESFADFMKRCAAGTAGACRPSSAILCGRALTARAVAVQGAPSASYASLFDAYTRSTREAFLGRQLAAYQSDADTRLKWLEAQNYPAIVTSAVRSLNEQLINDWKASVLDAHFGAVSGQFDLAGLTVLARQVQGQTLIDGRQLILTEMSQGWRGAMDALTVATRRWNDVYQDLKGRSAGAAFVSARAFDLYVLGGVADQLNVAAGSSFASSALAAGFSPLLTELRQLSLPFSALVFARDAEVVVSRSLDPLSSGDTLLSEISDSATAELDRAATAVDGILARAQKMAVDEQLLRNDLKNQVDTAFDELVSLCGFPLRCDNSKREQPECWPRVAAGECGFGTEVKNVGTVAVPKFAVNVVDFTNTATVSDAGDALLQVVQAEAQLDGARSALAEYKKVTSQMQASYDKLAETLQGNIEAATTTTAEINKRFVMIKEDGQDAYTLQLEAWYQKVVDMRAAALTARTNEVNSLKSVRLGNVTQDIEKLRVATALRQSADSVGAVAEGIEAYHDIVVDGVPDTPDNLSAPGKAAFRMASYGVTAGMKVVAQGLEFAATGLDVKREEASQNAEATLSNTEADNDLAVESRENELANFEGMIELEGQKGDIWEQQLRDQIEQMREELNLDRQLDRDESNLVDHRDALFARIVSEKEREIQIQQAELTLQQRRAAYLRVVQRAQLLDGRLRNLVAQRDQLNLNLGSPAVVFGWANQLEQAESRLERAKGKLMDWVVALEYLAVRPFMDARLQILLARNTYQLEEIVGALEDIQSRCGGALNKNTSVISLRDDVLGLSANQRDPVTGTVLTPAQTFREILGRAAIPVDKRVRLSADSTVGDLASRSGILASTFDLGLSDFANLASSCNAKVQDISVELVGAGLGKANPTVAVVYGGESSVRSCQPNIEDIVDTIGRTATAFAAVTVFKTAGRVLAPVAGVNDFGAANQTLVGLPLASQYTVVIDPKLGENSAIDWKNLEDVRLKITYGYQDFFPTGQCF